MAGRRDDEYIELGKANIRAILAREHAATWAEIEARSSERDGTDRLLIDVNHMITAREQLLAAGAIEYMPPARTRGGHEVPVYHLPVVRGTRRAVEDAAGRKRLLQGRWLGWAIGTTRYPNGLIGPAGDRVLSASVTDESLHGVYLPVEPHGGEVRSLFGSSVAGGPLDSGAFVVGRSGGLAGRPILVPMEMKNVRHWLFPRSPELFQILDKAARLVALAPEVPVAPLLVCRRRHYTARSMASDLGLLIVELHQQFLLPSAEAPPIRVEEVRTGLGFRFLAQTADPNPLLVRVLRETVPPLAEQFATRFASRAAVLAPYYATLRDDELSDDDRNALFEAFRSEALAVPDARGGW